MLCARTKDENKIYIYYSTINREDKIEDRVVKN